MKLRANFALDIGLKSNNIPKLDVLPPKTKRYYVNDNVATTFMKLRKG